MSSTGWDRCTGWQQREKDTSKNASSWAHSLSECSVRLVTFFYQWSGITARLWSTEAGGVSVCFLAPHPLLPPSPEASDNRRVTAKPHFKSGVQMDTSSCSKSWAPWHRAAAERGEQAWTDTSSCRYCVFAVNHMLPGWNSFTCDIRAPSLISTKKPLKEHLSGI